MMVDVCVFILLVFLCGGIDVYGNDIVIFEV